MDDRVGSLVSEFFSSGAAVARCGDDVNPLSALLLSAECNEHSMTIFERLVQEGLYLEQPHRLVLALIHSGAVDWLARFLHAFDLSLSEMRSLHGTSIKNVKFIPLLRSCGAIGRYCLNCARWVDASQDELPCKFHPGPIEVHLLSSPCYEGNCLLDFQLTIVGKELVEFFQCCHRGKSSSELDAAPPCATGRHQFKA